MAHHRVLRWAGLCWMSMAAGSAWAIPPEVRVVWASAAPGGNGRTWATAYPDLQAALDEAAAPGSGVSEIWVAEGTYVPTRRTEPGVPESATFMMQSGLGIYGGFVGTEERREDRDPVLHVSRLSPQNSTERLFHLVTASGTDLTAVLDGVTVRGGGYAGSNGGGVYVPSGAATLRGLVVSGGFARDGAGLYLGGAAVAIDCRVVQNGGWRDGVGAWISAEAVLRRCIIADNSGGGARGGGVFGDGTLIDCEISGNYVGYSEGGGVRGSPTMINCTIRSNQAERGAAIFGSPRMTGCTISDNVGGDRTGGVEGWATAVGCRFVNNQAAYFGKYTSGGGVDGGGVFVNCLFRGNLPSAIACQAGTTMVNCTVFGHSSTRPLAAIVGAPTLIGCVVWDGPTQAENIRAGLISYSTIQGWNGTLGGIGNNGTDPMLDAEGRLSAGSPCIDAGDNRAVRAGVFTDLDGRARFVDDPTPDTGVGSAPIVDRGAFEFSAGAFCYANCDGSTGSPALNVADFVCFMSLFAAGHPLANCDGSMGTPSLNVGDFVCFQSAFAAGCP